MTRSAALLAAAAALVLGVVAVYAPVGRHDWILYDDDVYLLENPHVARGLNLDELGWVSTHSYAANYHPLTWASHMLDVELFGLEDPAPHHRVNVALHALDAVLVLLLLAQLVGAVWPAAAGAALFALHPLRVESVAWAAERKDVLCAAFFLGALLLWLRHARARSAGAYLACCAAFVLALLAKPTAVAFPLVVVLLDALFPGPAGARPWREKVPLLVLAAAAGLVTFRAQSRDGSTSSLGALALDLRVLNALRSLGVYVWQTLVPRRLAVFYPHAAIVAAEPARALLAPAVGGLALLAGGTALAWRARRALPALAAGLGIFLALLLPVIGLVQVGIQAHADRYTYLASIGLALAVAGLLARLGTPRGRALGALASAVLAVVLGVLARRQLGTWQDTRTLFEHALRLDDRNYVAHLKLGELALHAGDVPRARASFERALELYPAYVEALINLAQCLRATGELPEAQALLERALLLDPGGDDVWLNLGAIALERGDVATARRRLETLYARAPSDPDVLYNLGHLALAEQRPDEAEERFLAVIALDPTNADAWSNLGRIRLAAGRTAEAIAAFERALAVAPADPLAHFNLGIARRKDGDRTGAAACFRRALELDPGLEPARAALQEEGGG